MSTAAAVVAAIAALATVLYARKTVQEAQATTKQLGEIREATDRALIEQKATTDALGTAHREEMDERERAFEAELTLRRLAQVEQVSALFLHVVEVARSECLDLEPPHRQDDPRSRSASRLPAILARLRTAVTVLRELGGPDLSAKVPAAGHADRTTSQRIWDEGIVALYAIEALTREDASLRLEHP
jgi:hypothetical protein